MKKKMKSKGYKAGGKMKTKGMKAGGKMKAKGMKAGGKMKAKGMAMGGRVSRGRGSANPLANQRQLRATRTNLQKASDMPGFMRAAQQSMQGLVGRGRGMFGRGMKEGGKLPMVEKDGKMVPFFAADGKGKMMGGGMVPKTKGYFKGGKTMDSGAVGRAGDSKSRFRRSANISTSKLPLYREYKGRVATAPKSRRNPR